MQEIHNTLKAATHGREIAHQGLTRDYKAELEKLLLIAPAVTEAVALGEKSTVLVQASRLRDRAGGKAYFGPVYFARGC